VRVVFVELTADQQAVVRRALFGRPADEVLVTEFSISIKRQDMITLAGLNWLNDEVSAAYLFVLGQGCQRLEGSCLCDVHVYRRCV
jgi:Ulp1 family protease